MISHKPDKLKDEINAAEQERDRYLSQVAGLIKRYQTRFFREGEADGSPTIAENVAYEFISLMQTQLAYSSPRVRVRSLMPNVPDVFGISTFGQRAAEIEGFINQWAMADDLGALMTDSVPSFFFSWVVWLTTAEDYPGHQGTDLSPQRPKVSHIDNRHFILDALAHESDPMRNLGPRFMGHMWKSDKEDLLKNKHWGYDRDAIKLAGADTDIDAYDYNRYGGNISPHRNEIVCWDLWVPERGFSTEELALKFGITDPRGYNGAIYTIAAGSSPGGMTKRRYELAPPRPAFCPPWGPYTMCGYLKVPGSPYKLSTMVATAEQQEEANAHRAAAAEDAGRYKKFGVGKKMNPADAVTLKNVVNGGICLLDDPKDFTTHEMGGVSDAQYRYNQYADDTLRRALGMSEAESGSPNPNVKATADAIAHQSSQRRIAGYRAAFKWGVSRVLRTAAWYAHYGESVRGPMAGFEEAEGYAGFEGGLVEGQDEFNYDRVVSTLIIEPYSMEHVDQGLMQRRMNQALEVFLHLIQILPNAPFIKVANLLDDIFAPYDIEAASEWLDMDMLERIWMQNQAVTESEVAGKVVGDRMAAGSDQGASSNGVGEMMSLVREQAGELRS